MAKRKNTPDSNTSTTPPTLTKEQAKEQAKKEADAKKGNLIKLIKKASGSSLKKIKGQTIFEIELEGGEIARIQLGSVSRRDNIYKPIVMIEPYNINKDIRHFILTSDGENFDLSELLKGQGVQDSYIIALEPKLTRAAKIGQANKGSYYIPDLTEVAARIKKDNGAAGIYRFSSPVDTSLEQSSFSVFIKVPENKADEATYLKQYLTVADHRAYRDVVYSFSPFQAIDSVRIDNSLKNDWPKNLLIFGAPGTGKSFAIDKKLEDLDWKKYAQRITFYEDYSYEKFVGAYVPKKATKTSKLSGKIDSQSLCLKSTGDGISYEFVPGPFLKMAADAWLDRYNHKSKTSKKEKESAKLDDTDNEVVSTDDEKEIPPRILVIEEINRANAASVFGDMFQLLDRNKDGLSEYGITLVDEAKEWLIEYLNDNLQKKDIPGIIGDADVFTNHFKLPPNFYIWATMNSADQGVFPLDSAFKRRWSFLYKSVTDNRTDTNRFLYTYVQDKNSPVFVSWDTLRSAINEVMCNAENNVEEDRCIGAWYFKPAEMHQIFEYTKASQSERFNLPNPLCDKLFHYLRQDVFRNNPGAIFHDKYHSMYKLREALANGTPIQQLLKIDLPANAIKSAGGIEFTVKDGKQEVTLDQLKEHVPFKEAVDAKNFVFDMNNAYHEELPYKDTLPREKRALLIDETMKILQANFNSSELAEYIENLNNTSPASDSEEESKT